MRPFYYSLALLALAACHHEAPFSVAGHGSESPFQPTAPVRLTFNVGADRDAVWLPGEAGLVYSAQLADQDGDMCLVRVPPTGGRVTRTWCPAELAARDSLNWFESAAIAPGGRFALQRTSWPPGQAAPRFKDLATAVPDSVGRAAVLLALPAAIGGVTVNDIARTQWVDDTTLVYRAGFAGTVCITLPPNGPCPTAFVRSGYFLARQSLGGAPAKLAGTDGASSVAADPGGDAVYYTLNNDARLYRQVLSTGATTVVYDHGTGNVIRDVRLAGSRAVVLAGGQVTRLDPATTSQPRDLQWDLGGWLYAVDLANGTSARINADSLLYFNPALSPSGRLVAERGGDLWMFQVP